MGYSGNLATMLLAGSQDEPEKVPTATAVPPATTPTTSLLRSPEEIDKMLGVQAVQPSSQTDPAIQTAPMFSPIKSATEVPMAVVSGIGSTVLSFAVGADELLFGTSGLYSNEQNPTYYRDVITKMNNVRQQLGYQPESPAAQAVVNTIALPAHAVQSVSRYAKERAIDLGLDEDRAAAVEEALNIVGYVAIDRGVRTAARNIRPALSRFRNAARKNAASQPGAPGQIPGQTGHIVDAEFVSTAVDLLEAARSSPEFMKAIDISKTILAAPANVTTIRPSLLTATSTTPNVSPVVRPTIVDMKAATIRDKQLLEEAGVVSPTTEPNVFLVNNRPRYVAGVEPAPLTNRPLQTQIDTVRDPEATPLERKDALETLKTTFKLRNEDTAVGLERLGFSKDEITALTPQVNRVRAYRFKNYTGELPEPVVPAPAVKPVQPALQTGNLPPEEPPAAGTVVPVNPPPTTPTVPSGGIITPTESTVTPAPPTPQTVSPTTSAQKSTALEQEFQSAVAALKANPNDVAAQNRLKAAAQALVLNDPQKIIGVKPSNLVVSPETVPTTTTPIVSEATSITTPTEVIPITPSVSTPTAPATPLQNSIANYRAGTASRDDLTLIKTEARNLIGEGGRIAGGLRQMGFTSAEVDELSPTLAKIRTPQIVAPVEPVATTQIIPLGEQRFYDADTIGGLTTALDQSTYLTGELRATASDSRVKIGFTEEPIVRGPGTTVAQQSGVQARSILLDTIGVNITTSVADIQKMVAENKLTQPRADAMIRNLQKQAEVAGVPLEQAHRVTPESLFGDVVKIAAERGLQVYNFNGREYLPVPNEIVQTAAKLNATAPASPSNITKQQATDYIEQQTAPVGRDVIQEMRDALEVGVDISDSLPGKIAPQFRQIMVEGRRTLNSSEVRRFNEILKDLATIAGSVLPQPVEGIGIGNILRNERGVIGRFGLTDEAKLAAQRLQADAQRAGISLTEKLSQLSKIPPALKALYTAYINGITNPPPPEGMTPRNMTMTSDSGNVVGQRVEGNNVFPPIYEKPLRALQEAPTNVRQIVLERAPYTLDKFGLTDPFQYAYRDVNRSFQFYAREIKHDTNLLRKTISRKDEEQIVAFMYDKSPEGRTLNNKNGITVPANLTENQAAALDSILRSQQVLGDMINKTRTATGRPPMNIIPDYLTFVRDFTLAERLGMAPSLITDQPDVITSRLASARTTPFPFAKLRTGAEYKASYNLLDNFEMYATAVMRDYHLSPFTAAVSEMINHKVVDLRTGKQNYELKNENPKLYEFMQNWTNRILGVPEFKLGPGADLVLRELSRNVGAAYVSANYTSALNQLGGMVNTWYAIGNKHTLSGIQKLFEDSTVDFKHTKFAMENSKLLDSRSAEINMNDLYTALRDLSRPAEVIGTLNNYGTSALRVLDMKVAVATWLGAYDLGIEAAKFNGTKDSHKFASNFADDILTKTQSSNLPGDMAQWQNSALGRAFFTLQNFTIANYNFLRHDVIGTQTGKYMKDNKSRVIGVTQMLIAQAMYDQVMGQIYGAFGGNYNGIFPDFLGTVMNTDDPDRNIVELAWELAQETSTILPVLGSVKYGRAAGGPVGQITADLKHQPVKAIGTTLGIPRQLIGAVQSSDIYEQYFGGMPRNTSRSERTGRSGR